MYVCICNAYRDHEIVEAAHRTPGGVDAVYKALGGEPQCRRCQAVAEILIEQARLGSPLSPTTG